MTHTGSKNTRAHCENGFTLIEALLAMVVVSSGLLALAGMQAGLAHSTDVSRQKSEAVRLAQEQIEKIRSYSQIHSVAGSFSWNRFGWTSLNSGSDSATTNAHYTRTWVVGGAHTDSQRPVSVSVEWTDRTGQVQSVRLNSVVSKSDPALSGSVGFPLPHNNIKQPKNRSLSIPVPAIRLANGLSAYQMDSNDALILSDNTGFIVKQCNTTVTLSTDLSTCANFTGYVLTGYVSKVAGATWPSGVDLADLTGLAGGSTGAQSKCKFGIAYDVGSGAALNDFYFYVCILAVPAAGGTWGGTVRLSGIAEGSTVCRYQYASTSTSAIDNNQHNLQPYSNVKQSLNNQNYVVFKPTGHSRAETCPAAHDTGGLQTILHQDCRASNSRRADDCPTFPFPVAVSG